MPVLLDPGPSALAGAAGEGSPPPPEAGASGLGDGASVPALVSRSAGTRAPASLPEQRLRAALAEHFQVVWRSLYRFGVPSSLVDDAAQHVFLTFASRVDEVPPARTRSFLITTAVKVAANVRRKVRRSPEVACDSVGSSPALTRDPEQMLEHKQRREALNRILDLLPLEQRSVFVLHELESFSLPEVAEQLSIPLGTATSRLRRARNKFEEGVSREQLRDRGGER